MFMSLVGLNGLEEWILAKWKMYAINNVRQLTLCHLQNLVLVNIFNA